MKVALKFAAVLAAALAAAPGVFAQGCAMCYAVAQAQDPRAARHLDYAILALLIPSVSLFAGVFIAAMRRGSGAGWDHGELSTGELARNPAAGPPASERVFSPKS